MLTSTWLFLTGYTSGIMVYTPGTAAIKIYAEVWAQVWTHIYVINTNNIYLKLSLKQSVVFNHYDQIVQILWAQIKNTFCWFMAYKVLEKILTFNP